MSSDPYLFVSDGAALISGYEQIENTPRDLPTVDLPPGRYAATIHLLDWEAEPGSQADDGEPSESALPDFVVLFEPEPDPVPAFRTKIVSFERQ